MAFTSEDIPDLTDKVAIVTGANTGLGKSSALELARFPFLFVVLMNLLNLSLNTLLLLLLSPTRADMGPG